MKEIDREAPPLDEEPDEGGGEIDGACIAVPNGEYELTYMNYETANYFGNAKLILHFAIVNCDDYGGTPVDRFYNVRRLLDRPGMFGRYRAKSRGSLVREFHRLVKNPERLDRINFYALKGKRVIGRLEKVMRGHDRTILAPEHQYTRIAELLDVLPDDDWEA